MIADNGQHRALVVCMLVGLAVRSGVAFFSGLPWFTTDTFEYIAMADGISSGQPISTFPNGYPLLMVLAKTLVPADRVMEAMICLNLAFATCIIAFAYDLARWLTRDTTCAALAAFFVALYPAQVNISRLVLSETAAGFFLTLGLWLLSRRWFIAAGLALGYATFIRTTLAAIIPALVLVFAVFRLGPGATLRMIGGSLVVLFSAQGAEWLGLLRGSNNMGPNFLIAAYSTSDRIDYRMSFSAEDLAHPIRAYLRFAWSHPIEFIQRRVGSLWQLWGAWPSSGDVRDELSPARRLIMGLRMPAIIVAGFGFRSLAGCWEAWALMVPVLVLTVVHVVFFSYWRFTAPVEPFVLIFVAAAMPEKTRSFVTRGLRGAGLA